MKTIRIIGAVFALVLSGAGAFAQPIPLGNQAPVRVTDTDGTPAYVGDKSQNAVRVVFGGLNPFNCLIALGAATTTECKAAPGAGLKAYVTHVEIAATSVNPGTVQLKYGTGSNCGTGTTNLGVPFNFTANTGAVPNVVSDHALTPLIPAAANAVCATSTGTGTYSVLIAGYVAP